MALWHWPNQWDEEKGDDRHWMRMVYFRDGTKMDISLGFLDDLREISLADTLPNGYDVGYRVLVDKDGVTGALRPPTYTAYILKPPTPEQFASRVETFWMESTYVAKYQWRDDIVAAKWRLNGLTDRYLREMLEWYVAAGRNWTWKPGAIGRGLDKALDPETRAELLACYAGADMEDLWQSLHRGAALYHRTGTHVAKCLGYPYPLDLDRRVTAYHQAIRDMDRQTGTREELARLLTQSHTPADR
jgi:aminoglycoside 6-adenylyltransferase